MARSTSLSPAAILRPVSVMFDRTSGLSGYFLFSSARRGLTAMVSPTDTAWTQIGLRPPRGCSCFLPMKPNRGRSAAGLPLLIER